jgi:NAD(P)-dependent dehydrogenase (short-subunit alcohol dehydrogenase family)
MSKKIIVTGAYGKIGKAISEKLADNKENYVVLVGRNEKKLTDTCNEIIRSTGNTSVKTEVVDLSRESSVIALSERWEGGLDILINNAATTPRSRLETPEGIEIQWATNVLGYFWMISYMENFMRNTPDPRIINVASYWAGGMDLNDPEFKKRVYNNDSAYRQTKQANRMLSTYFANKLSEYGISVNAVHPGDVNSGLSNNLGYGGFETPEQGADTPVWCAFGEELRGVSGKYFEHRSEVKCRFSDNHKEVESLIRICYNYSGI